MRSAIAVTIALALSLACAVPAAAAGPQKVVLLWLPHDTTVRDLAGAGFSPGVMSPGLGSVPEEQTYLDIGQGNRVFDSLYDTELPDMGPNCWNFPAVEERAASAPADIVPGLLARELQEGGAGVGFEGRSACAMGMRPGTILGPPHIGLLEIGDGGLARASSLARSAGLLIAIARPNGTDDPLPIGIAGRGFDGDLTSDSTRLDGYVLSTDVAPTILERFGLAVPSQMSGRPIETEGEVDPAAIESLAERMTAIPGRRGPVIGLALGAWLLALALAAAVGRRRAAAPAVRVVALAIVYLPALLLVGAALDASRDLEQLLAIAGAPALGALTLRLLGGFRALATASAVTVLAYALDVLLGSPLTSLSLLGPNPGLGVRFYGIGNELEAMLAVLVVAGAGATLSGFAPRASTRAGVSAFLGSGLLFAAVFAAGRFGADVGAAIVLPLGSAFAAASLAGWGRRRLALLVLVPLGAVALLALADLVSGAEAHLTRSVLDAGGLGDLGDVAQRRLELSAHSFARPVVFVFLPAIAFLGAWAYVSRRRLDAWLAGLPALRAGLLGALVATLAGTLANDSGALLLEIGSAYLAAFAGYAWAEAGDPHGRYP